MTLVFAPATTDRLVLTVLGAGTPYTAALVDALADVFTSPLNSARLVLRLVGRDRAAVELLGSYATARLGAEVVATDELAALDGSDIVLVQIRPGGMAGRKADEALAASLGAPADESLGVGGLSAMLRSAPVLRGLAADVQARCPEALVLVLTNPLSTCVAVLARAGVAAVGACELPTVTAMSAAAALGLRPNELTSKYTGLSHRGFVHTLTAESGADVLPSLVERLRLAGATLGGVGPDTIERLGVVPMKYDGLLSGTSMGSPGRADVVDGVRSQAFAELRLRPTEPPASLANRTTPWYELMVAPLVGALAGVEPVRLVLDVVDADGLVREHLTSVDQQGLTALVSSELTGPAATVFSEYEEHEQAVLDLLEAPSESALGRAVRLDPAIPERLDAVVEAALRPAVEVLADQPVASHWSRT